MKLCDKDILLIVYDFDGVMTDNRALLLSNGDEAIFINRSDGLAIESIKSLKIDQIIISSEKNQVVLKRAEKLGIIAINGIKNKAKELDNYIDNKNIKLKEIAFVGNDINDLEVMRCVGLKIAPADAATEILEIADFITNAKGGYGVIREVYKKLKEENE